MRRKIKKVHPKIDVRLHKGKLKFNVHFGSYSINEFGKKDYRRIRFVNSLLSVLDVKETWDTKNKDWSNKFKKSEEFSEIEYLIAEQKQNIREQLTEYIEHSGGEPPKNQKQLRDFIDSKFSVTPMSLTECIAKTIDKGILDKNETWKKDREDKFQAALRLVQQLEKEYVKQKGNFINVKAPIDTKTVRQLRTILFDIKCSGGKVYNVNTFRDHSSNIRTLLNKAVAYGFMKKENAFSLVMNEKKYAEYSNGGDEIAMGKKEFKNLFSYTPKGDIRKDRKYAWAILFLLSGVRYSDLNILLTLNSKTIEVSGLKYFHLVQNKTKDSLVLPYNPIFELLNWCNQNKANKPITNQRFNDFF